ncbi:MAG: hypothetical protein KIT17_21205 [Rubrivivax sp.]|nr:hypothetical protein [Rubrivivax sp.]
MNELKTQPWAWAVTLALSATCTVGYAGQENAKNPSSAGFTRAQVVAERDATRRTHRWDEPGAQWVFRAGAEPVAAPGMTRGEVRSEREAFARSYHWDESRGGWLPRVALQREGSALTRAQVTAETIRFHATHDWNEATQLWTEHLRRPYAL